MGQGVSTTHARTPPVTHARTHARLCGFGFAEQARYAWDMGWVRVNTISARTPRLCDSVGWVRMRITHAHLTHTHTHTSACQVITHTSVTHAYLSYTHAHRQVSRFLHLVFHSHPPSSPPSLDLTPRTHWNISYKAVGVHHSHAHLNHTRTPQPHTHTSVTHAHLNHTHAHLNVSQSAL